MPTPRKRSFTPGSKVRLKRTIAYALNGPVKHHILPAGLEGVVHILGLQRESLASERWVVWVSFPGHPTMAIFTTDIGLVA